MNKSLVNASQVAGYDETTGHLTRRANNTRQVIGHDNIAALRESLSNDRLALEQSFLHNGKAAHLLSAHSRLIDRYLHHVWLQLSMPDTIALVAVGGYGRAELYPKSVSYTHLRAHETDSYLVCRLLLEKKKNK